MISAIIPFWSYGPEADTMLDTCVSHLDVDEIIIIVNQPNERGEPCVGKHMNEGLRLAHGDYLLVITSSTYVVEGSARDLCQPDAITSPRVNDIDGYFHGCCFCISRDIYDKYGGMDEEFTAFYVDDDFARRMLEAGVELRCVPSVNVQHHGGRAHALLDCTKLEHENRLRFDERWAGG